MSACVCGETSCRNCPEHSEPEGPVTFDSRSLCWTGRPPIWMRPEEEPTELREATLFRLRRLSRHLCSQAVIDPGDSEYMVPPQWVRS